MPREKELFREQLSRVLERFPEQEMIPLLAVADWLKIDPRKLQRAKDSPLKKVGGRYYTTPVALARWMS